MKNKTKILEHLIKHKKIYLTILLLIILISPYFIRYFAHNPTIIGESSYFHLNQAEHINQQNFYQNPYHLFLSLNSLNNYLIYQAIPILLAILSLFLLINILKEFKLNPKNQFFFLIFLILSPTFIYTFTIINHHSFFIFLILLGFSLLLQKKRFLKHLSFPVFALIPFFDVFSSILTLLLLLTYFYLKKGNKLKPLITLVIILTLINIILKKILIKTSLKQLLLLSQYDSQNIFIDFFSDLGSLFGLSLFIILLAIIGLIYTWKKEKFYLAYSFLILFTILSIYQTSTLIYLNFFIIFFASFGFTYLSNKEWKLNIIKNTTLLLLTLGIIFSTLTYLDNLSSLSPNPEIKESLLWLKENSEKNTTIFSHPQDSYLIEYHSQESAFIHFHDPNFRTKLNTTNQIFQSSYIKTTFPLVEQNNIHYIYLPPKTKANLPLDRGLIFLFQNERFKRIYNQNNIEIWEFKKEE